jgi:hypothetical protein
VFGVRRGYEFVSDVGCWSIVLNYIDVHDLVELLAVVVSVVAAVATAIILIVIILVHVVWRLLFIANDTDETAVVGLFDCTLCSEEERLRLILAVNAMQEGEEDGVVDVGEGILMVQAGELGGGDRANG